MNRIHSTVTFAFGAALAASSVLAQPASGTDAPTRPQAPGTRTPQPMTSDNAQRSMLERDDRSFLENAVQGSHAEIEGSKLALEKSESQEVKDFARKMIDDHEMMVKEAADLASKKGLTPPDGPSIMQKTEITGLKALSGGAFDTMYVNRIAVAAHESTVEMFEEASKEAQDPDVRALASKALPTLREHLEMGRALNEKQDSK